MSCKRKILLTSDVPSKSGFSKILHGILPAFLRDYLLPKTKTK